MFYLISIGNYRVKKKLIYFLELKTLTIKYNIAIVKFEVKL